MARHREKDEEAGGEGLGKLLTRKRLWRDETGQIVARRRPEHEKRKRASASSLASEGHGLRMLSEVAQELRSSDMDTSILSQHGPLLSPPGSHSRSESASGLENPENAHAVESNDQWPGSIEDPTATLPLQEELIDNSYDFLCNASWGSEPLPIANFSADLPLDDMFGPDTGKLNVQSILIDLTIP